MKGVHLWAKAADSHAMYEWRRRSRARRSKENKTLRDRGAAAVEFALIAPLFFLVVFGGIELGLLARSYLSLEDVTRRAARVAAIQRDNENADQAILRTVQNRLDTLNGDLLRVVIFRADSLSTEFEDIAAACQNGTGGHSGTCTAYNAEDVADIVDDPMSIDPMEGFPAAARSNGSEVINIGIHIEYEYQFATGFFDTATVTSTSIEVVEAALDGSGG